MTLCVHICEGMFARVHFVSVHCFDVCVFLFSESRNLPARLKSTFKSLHRSAPVT